MRYFQIVIIIVCLLFTSCSEESLVTANPRRPNVPIVNGPTEDQNNLATSNFANQGIPNYIRKDNSRGNDVTDAGATLGRVLFYDTQLSSDNSTSCASCHQQAHGFGDESRLSDGVNGQTGRHSMRLINSRFSTERRFFWDERAATLEAQTTQPIRDHIEMGFSGQNGDPSFSDLIDRLSDDGNYRPLFTEAFGSTLITESRIQEALAQFVRSIQSFDSKYDRGRQQVNNDQANFPNFTAEENRGKQIFLSPPQFNGRTANRVGGGLGCNGCHRAPEFDIDPNSRNNGVITSASGGGQDTRVTRSPTLRDMFNTAGTLNTPMMHTGTFRTIDEVIDHYNNIDGRNNNNLDRRLGRGGGQNLNITTAERQALIAFLKTLTGENVYTDPKWSSPF